MKYRIVMADVDGTLVAPGDMTTKSISPRLIEAVSKARALGVIFSIATARYLEQIKPLISILKLNSPVIIDNGARIYDCMVEKYIYNSYLEEVKVNEILSIVGKLPFKVYVDESEKRHTFDPANPVKYNDVVKIVILHITPYEAQEVFKTVSRIENIMATKSVSGINPVKESIHITSSDGAKEKSLKRIADLSGVNMEQVMAIGDSYNDFSIMTASGFKVAVGNAVPEIKAIADYIAPTFDQDAVAHILEKFVLSEDE